MNFEDCNAVGPAEWIMVALVVEKIERLGLLMEIEGGEFKVYKGMYTPESPKELVPDKLLHCSKDMRLINIFLEGYALSQKT